MTSNLNAIRNELIIVISLFACAAIMGGAAWAYLQQVKVNDAIQRQAIATLRSQADEQEAAYQLVLQHHARYQALQARGLLNTEHRLSWVEFLIGYGHDDPWRQTRFQFTVQRRLDNVAPQGGMQVLASEMTLDMGLRDENDWSQLRAGLHALPGWPAEKECTLVRGEDTDTAPLKLKCVVEWLSLGHQANGEAQP